MLEIKAHNYIATANIYLEKYFKSFINLEITLMQQPLSTYQRNSLRLKIGYFIEGGGITIHLLTIFRIHIKLSQKALGSSINDCILQGNIYGYQNISESYRTSNLKLVLIFIQQLISEALNPHKNTMHSFYLHKIYDSFNKLAFPIKKTGRDLCFKQILTSFLLFIVI